MSARQAAAIVGIGETPYYKHGGSPDSEFKLACTAILRAADDAGLDVRSIDGFASFSGDRNEGALMAGTLGVQELNFANMVWGGGGGGCAAAVGNAVAAVQAGLANYVVVYRALAQGQFGRFGQGNYPVLSTNPFADFLPHGMFAPVHGCAMHTRRFMDVHGVDQTALAAVALASYAHAQRNPRAVMHGRPLTRETYDASRWIAEPLHLFDCCQENDGAAAVIVTTADRARDLASQPVYVIGAAQGAQPRWQARDASQNYLSANFSGVAAKLYERAGLTPHDIDVVQAYENFTGGVVMSLVDHGFCKPDEVNDFMTPERFAFDGGGLPLNTSGGNLAEAYIHGLELVNEAVRQVRGTSTAQVSDVNTSMVIGGPFDMVVSDLILARTPIEEDRR